MSARYSRQGLRDRILHCLAIIFLLAFLVSAALFVISLWEKHQGDFVGSGSDALKASLEYNGREYVLKEDVETFLFLGLDKFGGEKIESYNNDKQADFLLLLVVDNKNSTYTALHINRDTITEMNILGVAGDKVGTVNKQIALAHTYGNGKEVSCRNVAQAVSKLLLDVEIDHYMSLTMDGVPIYNDYVGGVEVTVLDDFSGIDDTLIKDKTVTLMGQQALTYVRSRYGLDDDTNSNRMKRQKQYLEAVYNKTKLCLEEDEAFIENAFLKLSPYLVSDCSANKLQKLMEKLSSYTLTEIESIKGENVVGEEFMEFHPDKEALKATTIELFYKPKN